jgi:rhodanese-related sulfurtransferase
MMRARRKTMGRGARWIGWSVMVAAALASPALAVHVPGGPVPVTSPEYAKRLVDDGDGPTFIDLRPEEEYRQGRVPGARSIPLRELRRRHAEVPRVGRVVLYCACSDGEIQAAYQFLRDQGYRNVSVMAEGLAGWTRRGYSVEK